MCFIKSVFIDGLDETNHQKMLIMCAQSVKLPKYINQLQHHEMQAGAVWGNRSRNTCFVFLLTQEAG